MTTPCRHESFETSATVTRLMDDRSGARYPLTVPIAMSSPVPPPCEFRLDLRVRCASCGKDFVFDGLPMGYLFHKPTSSADRRELRAPIMPQPVVAIQ